MRKRAVGLIAALAVGLSGVGIVQHYEGVKTTPYRDVGGVLTVCYGHTGNVENRKYTLAECTALLDKDIAAHAAGLDRCVTYPVNKTQAYALTSFAFNVGVSNACKSTLVRKLNAGDVSGAKAEFGKWVYVRKVRYRGLVRRRAAEADLFSADPRMTDAELNRRFKKLVTSYE